MFRLNKTHLAQALLLCGLLGYTLPWSGNTAYALDDETREEKTEELKQLRHRIQRLQSALDKTRTVHDQVRIDLRDIELKINKHIKELNYINHRLRRQIELLAQLKQDKQRYRKDLAEQRKQLAKQLRAAFMVGRQEYMKLLLNQQDPGIVGRSLAYYGYLSRSRTTRIEKAITTLNKVKTTTLAIDEERGRLNKLAIYARKQKQELEASFRSRGSILTRLQRELEDKSTTLTRLMDDEQQLRKLLDIIDESMPELHANAAKKVPFNKLKGKLAWPVRGRINRLFGKQRGQTNVKWNGVVINAPTGRKIQAVTHGRIAYADWLRGYGLLVIIDHGNGYMSLYAHNQSLLKEAGDWVQAGDEIATVGASGGQTSSGLYFEVRHNGKPTNPTIWCRRSNRRHG